MGRHRSRLKILANVLSVISSNNGSKKTQIMYQAYLSYKLLVQYLNDVVESGLAQYGNDGCYRLTEKGELFLVKFDEYAKSRETINENLKLIEDQRLMLDDLCSNRDLSIVDSKAFGKSSSQK